MRRGSTDASGGSNKKAASASSYTHRVKDGSYPIKVAIFPEWVPQAFDHVGKSFKLTKEDVGK